MSKGPWKRKPNVLLAGEMRDEGDPEIDVSADDGEADVNDAPDSAPVVVVPEPPAAPVAPASFTMTAADLQALVTAAVQASTSGNAAMADAITQGIKESSNTVPENKFSPDISDYNPLGDRAHPRPGLKCEMFYGIQDPNTKVISRTLPLEPNDLTVYEQIALNTLEPVNAVVRRLDGAQMKVSIVPDYDPVTDALSRLTIVVPTALTAKKSLEKNMLPGPLNIVYQITGHDYSRLSLDDLQWFMAEHRAKRYVSVRETVAA